MGGSVSRDRPRRPDATCWPYTRTKQLFAKRLRQPITIETLYRRTVITKQSTQITTNALVEGKRKKSYMETKILFKR